MSLRNHYDVLGVSSDASADTIRDAYRGLAREYHPDRTVNSSAVGGSRTMPTINEAYRVLNDPGRRALYDRELAGAPMATATSPSHAPAHDGSTYSPNTPEYGPARIPWRMLLVCATLAIAFIVVAAQFTDPQSTPGPDGIMRIGDCVEVLPNGDAREIACAGSGDLVIRNFIPFDRNCPGQTVAHRDRQGMGVACVSPSLDAPD